MAACRLEKFMHFLDFQFHEMMLRMSKINLKHHLNYV